MLTMASAKLVEKSKGPIVNPGLCRCCRSIKKCRILTAEYEWSGKKEVYSDMFVDCFGLLISHLDGECKEACICATCVVRLRDAFAFRDQVLLCEQEFLRARDNVEGELKLEMAIKVEPCFEDGRDADDKNDAVDDVHDRDDNLNDHVSDDMDDLPLNFLTQPLLKPEPTASEDIQIQKTKRPTDSSKDKKHKPSKVTRRKSLKLSREKVSHDKVKTKKLTAGKTMIKNDVLDDVQRLERKQLKKADLQEKKPIKLPKKKDSHIHHEDMVYKNAITIAHNSYVCPFTNRISNYYCFYCKDMFTNPVELREHTLTHDAKKWFEGMMENKKIPKIDITRIDCRLCDMKINDLVSLKTHLIEHGLTIYPVENEFLTFKLALDFCACTECGATFPYFDMLKKHMVDHFGTYICDQCGACFLEENSLKTHIKNHSKTEALFPCEICGKNLKSKYSRTMHVTTVHEKKPTVNCYKCDSSFMSYALRNRHLIEVHGDKRVFPCKLCDKVYNRRKTLVEHNRRNHLKVLRHQCDLCDQRFYLPSRLKEHMSTHTGERNYRCEICDKSYPRLQSLQEHLRTHGSDRRYKCDVCNSVFTQSRTLKSHMETVHQRYDVSLDIIDKYVTAVHHT